MHKSRGCVRYLPHPFNFETLSTHPSSHEFVETTRPQSNKSACWIDDNQLGTCRCDCLMTKGSKVFGRIFFLDAYQVKTEINWSAFSKKKICLIANLHIKRDWWNIYKNHCIVRLQICNDIYILKKKNRKKNDFAKLILNFAILC